VTSRPRSAMTSVSTTQQPIEIRWSYSHGTSVVKVNAMSDDSSQGSLGPLRPERDHGSAGAVAQPPS